MLRRKRSSLEPSSLQDKTPAPEPGNHDSRNVGYLYFEDFFGARTSCHSLGGVTVVGVDSSQPDIDDGHVDRERYDWIAKSFETDDFKVLALSLTSVVVTIAVFGYEIIRQI